MLIDAARMAIMITATMTPPAGPSTSRPWLRSTAINVWSQWPTSACG